MARANSLSSSLSRGVAVMLCFCLAYGSSSIGVNALLFEAKDAYVRIANSRGGYTDEPGPVFYGRNPGRALETRGGIWDADRREHLRQAKAMRDERRNPEASNAAESQFTTALALLTLAALQASMNPALPSAEHFEAPQPWQGAPESGGGEPGEGSASGGDKGNPSMGGSSVNTANGNRMTFFHTAGWDARGDVDVRFTITHNSFGDENDALGHKWTHSYDWDLEETTNGGQVGVTVHRGDGSWVTFIKSGSVYVAPNGEFDSIVKNGNDTWTYTTRGQIRYDFGTNGLLNTIKDRSDNTLTIYRGTGDRIEYISDPNGRTLDFSYTSGKITGLEDPAGRVWEFGYDGSGDLTSIQYPGETGYEPVRELGYTSHNIVDELDLRGQDWDYTYSGNKFASYTDPESNTWTYTYFSTYTRITDPNSYFVDHNYSAGKLASVEDEGGFSDQRSYNADGLITLYKDKREMEWEMTWDANGNRLSFTNPISKQWKYTYSATNDLIEIETPLAHVTTLDWDAEGNLESVENGENETVVTNVYDAYGLLETTEDGEGRITTLTRNSKGEITQIDRPEEDPIVVEYDDLSRPLEITDQFSNVTTLHYDDLGRVYEADLPGGADVEATYDDEGNVLTTKDELNHETEFVYDARGLLQTLINARGDEENYSYDDAGRLIAIENGRGYTREFSLLERGEVAELLMPDGTWEAWGYNANGDVSEYETNGMYATIGYGYDDASRLEEIDYPSGTDTSFSYDDDGRTDSMVDSSGTTSWDYDDADRLIELTTPQGVMEYTYNLASQRETMVEIGPPDRTTTYAYDAAGRLESLTNADSEETLFDYDEGSRLEKMTRENGTYTAYGYDARSRVNSLIHKKANHDTISSEEYTWDAASNLESKTVDSVETEYTYDAIDQILTEARSGYSASYTYDANGNRATKTLGGVTDTYICDEGDKLTSITRGGNTIRSFTYEKFGRMATSVENSVTTTYAYDFESRLTSVTKSGMTTNTFTYNGLDTRVGKVDSGGTKTFKRDGAYVTDPVLSDGAAKYTPGISEKRGSDTKYSLSNYLGSTTKLIEPDNDVSDTKQYDAFGNVTSSTGSTPHPFYFAGQWGYQTDSDTGIQLLGHRYYDPTIGRFLTRDPEQEGANWLIYCENNPLASVDEDGQNIIRLIFQIGKEIVKRIIPRTKPPIPRPKPNIQPVKPPTPPGLGKPRIHADKQGKHQIGHKNFISGRSEFTHHDPQGLINKFAGKGHQVGKVPKGQAGFKEKVDFGERIGTVTDKNGVPIGTTKGIIHYDASGTVHIVPVL